MRGASGIRVGSLWLSTLGGSNKTLNLLFYHLFLYIKQSIGFEDI